MSQIRSVGKVRVLRVYEMFLCYGMGIWDFGFYARVAFSEVENIPYVLGRLDVAEKVQVRFERDGTSFVIE